MAWAARREERTELPRGRRENRTLGEGRDTLQVAAALQDDSPLTAEGRHRGMLPGQRRGRPPKQRREDWGESPRCGAPRSSLGGSRDGHPSRASPPKAGRTRSGGTGHQLQRGARPSGAPTPGRQPPERTARVKRSTTLGPAQ